MLNKEYSIACLLNKSSVAYLNKNIHFLDKNNVPHISLFQFECSNDDYISFIEEQLKYIKLPTSLLSENISIVENNIFLNIQNNTMLQSASDKLANLYSQYNNKKPLSQINFEVLSAKQRKLVEEYGIYWIKEYFRPHVTLAYEQFVGSLTNINIPERIEILPLNIYRIDKRGKINICEFQSR